MFNKILVANRGEIACRVMKTARSMGIQTVAIYSTADKNSLHVAKADQAYWVGDAPAIASYLNSDAIIKAAIESGAEAIHPGYGFLSENTEFAQACSDAGIVFIGPSISAMQAMASKQLAKQLLEQSNVPLTPGYHGSEQSDERLFEEAYLIGFPVLLKAAAGGGGKGMRAVHEKSDFMAALAGARRESMASFANDTMIIEKLVTSPRHIEIQIMADNFDNVVHLFERDCSIQRRHQKIIEEAPAPHLNPSLRQKLTHAACEVARSINYRGAGTVEFLVDKDDNFYFMEMNTRLQVEHPVTEMITGLDLVAWQIQIAANQPLPCLQDAISAHGHAIECRIYAEDPHQDFIPSTGQLHFLKEPEGLGIRIDTGVTQHSHISQYYDPMIAKLIAYGDSRTQALQRMQQALKHFFIGGVKSNIPFLQAICKHPRFVDASFNTDFLAEESFTLPLPDKNMALIMAASFDYLTLTSKEDDPLLQDAFAWQMHLGSSWTWRYFIDKKEKTCEILPIDNQHFLVKTTEREYSLAAHYQHQRLTLDDGKQTSSAWIESNASQLIVYLENGLVEIERFSWSASNANTTANPGLLSAPMPATIVALLKKQGDIIKKGEHLMVLEAMKMEHTIQAPRDGTIAEFFYDVGAQVNEGAELLRLDE